MRVGVLGGTFDPIHVGHLRAAEVAREALRLDEVWLMPAATPPHRNAPSASAQDRFAMAALAAGERRCFRASDRELRRAGPSYTVDTLAELRREAPADELVLILGSDTWAETPTWKAPERLFAMCEVAVVPRPGGPAPGSDGPAAVAVHRLDGVFLAVSSTEIRRLLREGKGIRYLVPAAVADYIEERGLYS
jgi:nicotinate-nucleotide adenylyltransferase